MLSDNEAIATVAVKYLKTAAEFYEGKLGFEKRADFAYDNFSSIEATRKNP